MKSVPVALSTSIRWGRSVVNRAGWGGVERAWWGWAVVWAGSSIESSEGVEIELGADAGQGQEKNK